MSYCNPDFKPFSSGCGMCKPLTDYYSQTQTGGGNYSEDGLIPQSNGKNFYKPVDYSMPLDNKFIKNNFGIDYATANGGVKNKKSKSKKLMKGGVDIDGADNIKGLSPGDYALFSSGGGKGTKHKKKLLKGGFAGTMNNNINYAPSEEMHHIPGEEMDYQSGGKKTVLSKSKSTPSKLKSKSKSKSKSMTGGMESSGATSLPMRFYNPDTPLDNYPELSGNGSMSAYGSIESGDIGTGMLAPYTASTCQSANPSSGMKTGGGKKSKKSMNGGSDDMPGFSDKEYAQYLASGGKKNIKKSIYKNKKSMSGGSDDMPGFSDKEYAQYLASGGKKNIKKSIYKNKKLLKGGSTGMPIFFDDKYTQYLASGGKKNKKSKSKSMSGGMESSGATSLPMRFYNPDTPLDNYPELSGNGSMSAYGAIESGDIGTGMLAPYTASTCQTANPSSGMKTGGGSKKIKKSLRGGTKIPYISDSPVSSIQNGVDGAINGFSGFMAQLDADYLKSVAYVKSIKIGNQRLIQGGSKEKKILKNEKKEKKQKKLIKKPITKKMSMKKGGSNGSDFALTLNSRGPVNAPDNYWGVPGEEWFRQFNKTGDYIPNSKLPYAATPLLAGSNDSGVVSGYDESTLAYPSV